MVRSVLSVEFTDCLQDLNNHSTVAEMDRHLNQTAKRTLSRVTKGMQDGQCACLPDILRMIQTLTAKVPDLAVQELADLIKNDTVVLERVISVANSVGYNPTGLPISSVSEAIQIIGFDRVRSLSMALILLENSHAWQFTDERRQATLASLSAGLLAQELAPDVMVNPELAFICGALRGFGRIVLTTYLLDELKEIESDGPELASDADYIEALGMTPLDLGFHLMQASHMSPVLLKTLKDYRPDRYRRDLVTPEDRLLALADYSYQLAVRATGGYLSAEQFAEAIQQIHKRYKRVIEVEPELMVHNLRRVSQHLQGLVDSCGHDAFSQHGIECLKARSEKQDPPPAIVSDVQKIRVVELPLVEDEAKKLSDEGTKTWQSGLDHLRELSTRQPVAGLRAAVSSELLRATKAGFKADEGWLFLPPSSGDGFVFADGFGSHVFILQGRTRIHTSDQGVFGLCLKRGESVFIHDAASAKIRPHLPAWFCNNVQIRSFLLLSIRDNDRPCGLLLAGWKNMRQVEIQPAHARMIRELLGVASQLIKVAR